jgi:23S rRNA (adenine2503-C2)-methyltransferase
VNAPSNAPPGAQVLDASPDPSSDPSSDPSPDPSPDAGRDASLNLRDLDEPSLAAALAPHGVDRAVARRIFRRVQREGRTDFDDVRGLLAGSRQALARVAAFPDLEVVDRRKAADGFVKYLFRLPDGPLVEAVRIPLPDPEAARALKVRRREGRAAALEPLPTAKYTLCVSSQAGCALACDFCATGRLGAIRSLRTWEILAQVRHVAAEAEHPIRGVVFMGMGEPFLNYDNVIRAGQILSDPAGMAISAKAITISTAGVVPMIRRFTEEGHRFRLIVSLSAPTSAQRLPLMPIERRWPLPELMDAIRAYAAKTGERVTLAYVAIGGVNMGRAEARALAALVEGLKVKINLIDVSDESGDGVGGYRPPSPEELAAFREELAGRGIPVVRRYSGGNDIGAGCGTLSASRRGGELVELGRPAPSPGAGAPEEAAS